MRVPLRVRELEKELYAGGARRHGRSGPRTRKKKSQPDARKGRVEGWRWARK